MRRLASLAATATLAVAGLTATAPTAGAALPTCNASGSVPVAKNWSLISPNIFDTHNFRCILRYGDRYGDWEIYNSVLTLQRTLNYCYRTHLAVDGIYGSQTRAAVMRVQRLHKIKVDGVYGPQTRSAMFWRLYSYQLDRWSERCYSPI
ncbi:MAG: peptidoglycan-binding domain-containing protein [Kribbellaceae bacterium]